MPRGARSNPAPAAIKHGYFKGAADDPAFSFSDVYDPVDFSGARFCEARVWHIFRTLAGRYQEERVLWLLG